MSGNGILISVCTITYNHEKFIAQAIESVLAQKCDYQIEMIIGDDCSTDGTAAIVKEYHEKYPEIIKPIFHNPNVGAKNNSLQCLRACKGDYIAALEGDDYWVDPLKLQKQVHMMENHPELAITSHGAFKLTDILELVENPFEADSFWSTKDAISDKWFMMTASLIWRKSAMKFDVPWVSDVTCGDHALILLASLEGNGFHFKEPMSVYRVHPGGVTKKFTSQDTINYIYLFKKFNETSGYKFDKEVRNRIEQLRSVLIRDYYAHNQRIGPFSKYFWVNIIYSLKYIKLREIPHYAKITLQSISSTIIKAK